MLTLSGFALRGQCLLTLACGCPLTGLTGTAPGSTFSGRIPAQRFINAGKVHMPRSPPLYVALHSECAASDSAPRKPPQYCAEITLTKRGSAFRLALVCATTLIAFTVGVCLGLYWSEMRHAPELARLSAELEAARQRLREQQAFVEAASRATGLLGFHAAKMMINGFLVGWITQLSLRLMRTRKNRRYRVVLKRRMGRWGRWL